MVAGGIGQEHDTAAAILSVLQRQQGLQVLRIDKGINSNLAASSAAVDCIVAMPQLQELHVRLSDDPACYSHLAQLPASLTRLELQECDIQDSWEVSVSPPTLPPQLTQLST